MQARDSEQHARQAHEHIIQRRKAWLSQPQDESSSDVAAKSPACSQVQVGELIKSACSHHKIPPDFVERRMNSKFLTLC
jgi:hypothetical protein